MTIATLRYLNLSFSINIFQAVQVTLAMAKLLGTHLTQLDLADQAVILCCEQINQ